MESVEARLVNSQLRWAGNVAKMIDECLHKVVIYDELALGKRKYGGQKLCHKDTHKPTLTNTTWKQLA